MHSYRKKTLLNYQDLSLVYGNELISGHQGCMHQDENFEDVTLQVKTGKFNEFFLKARFSYEVCGTDLRDV
jgi:hypothetical protein